MPDSAPAPAAADDTTFSFDKGVDDIAALLTGPDDPAPTEEGEAQVDNTERGNEPGPDAVDTPVDAADAPAEEEDGPGYSKGKFASDDAKVTLKDGTILSVTDLKRGFLAQRDYYRQTEDIRSQETALKAEKSQIGETAQALAQQRDFLLAVAPKLLPAPPDRAMLDPNSGKYDPLGFQQAQIEYNDKIGLINQIYHQEQAEKTRRDGETVAEKAERQKTEATKLLEAIPEFRDHRVYQSFMGEVGDVMAAEYGFSTADLKAAFEDHRYYKAMRDLVLLSKARKKAPQVKQQVQNKPKLLTGSTRSDPKARTTRNTEQRREQLRSTGDFDAGVSLIESLL